MAGRQAVLVCPNTKFNSVIIAVFNTGKGVVGDDCLADIQLNRIADKTVIIRGCFRGESAIVKCELTGSINDKFCFVAKSEILNGDVITGNGDRTIHVGDISAVKHGVVNYNSKSPVVPSGRRYSSNGLSFSLLCTSNANTAVGSRLSTIVRANNTDKNLAFMVSSYNYRFEFENLLCAGMCFRCFFHLSLSLFASASTGHTCFPYHSMFVCGKQETFEKNCKENVKVLLRIQKERIALHARA